MKASLEFFWAVRAAAAVCWARDVVGLVPKFTQEAGVIEIFTPWELVQYPNNVRDELVPFLTIGSLR